MGESQDVSPVAHDVPWGAEIQQMGQAGQLSPCTVPAQGESELFLVLLAGGWDETAPWCSCP